jgi:hypothetical protein
MSNTSNSKFVLDSVRNHVTQSVSIDGTVPSFSAAAVYVWHEFIRVTNNDYYKHHFPNLQDRFSNYLDGLPHSFLIYYNEMETYLDTLGLNNNSKTKFSEDKIHKMYHFLIYKVIYREISK